VAAGDPAAGKEVYDKTCKTCHGATGTANPNIAKMMKVEIKDLGSSEIQKMKRCRFQEDHHRGTREDEAGQASPVRTSTT